MRDTPFKGLTDALSSSADWAAVHSAWREAEDLMASLRQVLPATLSKLIVQVRRGDPVKGLRGSQVTVVAQHAAAAAKLRLALADWPQSLRSQGWGIQHIKVTALREQELSPSRQPISPRTPMSRQVREDFGRLAQQMPHEGLQRALKRIAGRRA
ncbi:MAG: hypothetical protein FGM18_07320 [Burkholderiaceae bacterium]|nr:hypothetical protein [Burkholderiaceae bacterium]